MITVELRTGRWMPWNPNGPGAWLRPWYVRRWACGGNVCGHQSHVSKRHTTIYYKSESGAQRAADRLNKQEGAGDE